MTPPPSNSIFKRVGIISQDACWLVRAHALEHWDQESIVLEGRGPNSPGLNTSLEGPSQRPAPEPHRLPKEGGPSPGARTSTSKHPQGAHRAEWTPRLLHSPNQGNLNAPRWAAQRWQGILTKGGNSPNSVVVGMTHVYAARLWPSLASLFTCCLNAAARRMLASVATGTSMPGCFHSIRGHPSVPTRSPLEVPRSRKVTPPKT